MSNPEIKTGGVVVQLVQACPFCNSQLRGNVERCPECHAERPATGWIPVGTDVGAMLSDERVDDPDTASSAPPPVVPVDVAVAARALPEPMAEEPMTMAAVLVRFFGVFVLSTVVTALLIVGLGSLFLPPVRVVEPVPTAPVTAVPVQPLAPVPALQLEEAPELLTEDPVAVDGPVADPLALQPVAPQPVVAPVTAVPRPADQPDPAPVAEVEPEPVAQPVPEPVQVEPEPTAPAQAGALSGSYIGRADGKPISMELVFGAEQRLSATLRVAGRNGTEVHTVAGTYTLAPDGSADFALTDRTDDGVVGYSGSISGDQARGIVTVDGRRRGRFSAGR